jgi:hypothetical protein
LKTFSNSAGIPKLKTMLALHKTKNTSKKPMLISLDCTGLHPLPLFLQLA